MAKFEGAVFAVPMQDHSLKCPHCHSQLEVNAMVAATPGDVHTTGGTPFKTNLSASIQVEIKRIEINHTCEYNKE